MTRDYFAMRMASISFEKKEMGSEIYLVIEGAFNVEQGEDQSSLTTLSSHCIDNSEPCFVGEMAYFGNGMRTASIRCSGTTYALEMRPPHLEIILDQLPTFTQILCRQFTQRLREANDTLCELNAATNMQIEHRNFDIGEEIIVQGDTADELHLLIFGELEWIKDGQIVESQTLMDFIEPDTFFTNTKYIHTVRSIGPTLTACMNINDKEAIVRNYPELVLKIMSEE